MSARADPGTVVRQVIPAMRTVFVVGSLLVAAAGFQLYVLTDHTERFFAWTIGVPFTAAFYWTALVLASSSAGQHQWVRVRVGVPGVTLFLALTLVVSIVHIESFHIHEGSLIGGRPHGCGSRSTRSLRSVPWWRW